VVDLGSYSSQYFAAKGTKGRDGSIQLTVSCLSNYNAAYLHFSGEQDPTDPSLFKNTASDNGIAIELVHSTAKGDRRIDAGQSGAGQLPFGTYTGIVPLKPLKARMISTRDHVSGGLVSAIITIDITEE
jgi:type 1 fimbria pilin